MNRLGGHRFAILNIAYLFSTLHYSLKMKLFSLFERIARSLLVLLVGLGILSIAPQPAEAYPFWAQQTYPETPREPTGRIVCANCHLAAKPTQIEVPQSVLPDTVFEAVVKLPYDHSLQQVTADGTKGPLNVGAVLMLPKGFKIAPEDRIPEEMKEKIQGLYYQPYGEGKDNTVIIGPLPGDQYSEIIFPVLSPDPSTDKSISFGKYPIHVGGNRGRGQVYPTGEKSNNGVYSTTVAGTIASITPGDAGAAEVTIQTEKGESIVEKIPAGPTLLVARGDTVTAGQALTNNPNVGGFGQKDTEIVLQNPNRIYGLVAFVTMIMLSQIFLVLKKKQVERVQAAELEM
jgi:apocytochrome f